MDTRNTHTVLCITSRFSRTFIHLKFHTWAPVAILPDECSSLLPTIRNKIVVNKIYDVTQSCFMERIYIIYIFGRLRTKVLQHRSTSLSTKLKVYNAIVLSSLLYCCEIWTLYRRHLKKLEQFHTDSLARSVSNREILERANTTSIEAMILKAQLRWTGHVIRMDESRIPRSPASLR